MNDHERERVAELRCEGLGYKAIAREVGVPRSTVRAFLRRTELAAGKAAEARPCKWCGAMVAQAPGRKAKLFCSDRCRSRWWGAHIADEARKGMTSHLCAACGKEFHAYASRGRKYCCRACYRRDRFGTGGGE